MSRTGSQKASSSSASPQQKKFVAVDRSELEKIRAMLLLKQRMNQTDISNLKRLVDDLMQCGRDVDI